MPIAFTGLAATARLYPFHGRLVLFLAPAFLLLIAEGAASVSERINRRWAWIVVVALLFLFPTFRDLYHLASDRQRDCFDSHGDRDPYARIVDRFPFGPF